MRVDYIGLIPAENGKHYSTATVKSEDGTEIKLQSFVSEETMRLLEREVLETARKKFMVAAQETNLLTLNDVPLAANVFDADGDCPF